MNERVIMLILFLLCMGSVIYARNNNDRRDVKEVVGKGDKDEGEGTYNPKNAWMFVDSRRRVLPDIDVEAHFASVENNILSDIHNYHMVGQTSVTEENNEEDNDEYVISRFTPSRAIWGVGDDYGVAVDTLKEDDEYVDTEDSYYAESTNTVQSAWVEDRQLSTVGVGGQGQGSIQGGGQKGHSVLGITANSAIGLLGLLLFINILRDVIAQITGRRRRRRREEEVDYGAQISYILQAINKDFAA